MKNYISFLNDYYSEYEKNINPDWLFDSLEQAKNKILEVQKLDGKLIFFGNGASSSISSHAALDFTKQAKVKSSTFHDPSYITAISNDLGYEKWIKETLKIYGNQEDLVFFISVSGESPNILLGADFAKENNIDFITFTGKKPNNSLKKKGNINFWVDSEAYNIVEGIHMIWITTLVDMIIGKSVYRVDGK